MTGKEADALTRDYIETRIWEYFGHSTGHGIGLEVHEGPGLIIHDQKCFKEKWLYCGTRNLYSGILAVVGLKMILL